MTGELHGEIAGEPIRALHDDRLGTVRRQPLEHLHKARALIDGVSTAYSCIVVLADDCEPCTSAKAAMAPRSS